MSDFSLFLDAETLDDAGKVSDFNLSVPDPADNDTFRAGSQPDLGTWQEALKIVDTVAAYPKDGPTDGSQLVYKCTMDVLGPAEGGWKGNDGKVFYYNVYIERAALKAGHDSYKTTMRRVNIMKSLFSALGQDLTAGVDPGPLFSGDADGRKPMVGLTVKAVVRKNRWKDRAGQTKEGVDVQGFLAA